MNKKFDWAKTGRAAYLMAHEHGWHDPMPDLGTAIALMHSELSEALEWHRMHDDGYGWVEVDGKPEGVASEFADVLIRIMDYSGEYAIPFAQELAAVDTLPAVPGESFGEVITDLHWFLSEGYNFVRCNPDLNYATPQGLAYHFAMVAGRILGFCQAEGVDIYRAVEVKMAYNETRPIRHGKRY